MTDSVGPDFNTICFGEYEQLQVRVLRTVSYVLSKPCHSSNTTFKVTSVVIGLVFSLSLLLAGVALGTWLSVNVC